MSKASYHKSDYNLSVSNRPVKAENFGGSTCVACRNFQRQRRRKQ